MLLIRDLGVMHRKQTAAFYREALELAEDVRACESIDEAGDFAQEDRVIYITSLEEGGRKYQFDLLRDHPQVSEWFVLSEDTEQYLLDHFALQVGEIGGKLQVFSEQALLKKALKKPPVRKNSCLVCAMQESVDTAGLCELLCERMKGWQFESVCLARDPAALEETACSRVLLVGEKPSDFLTKERMPEGLRPILVLTRMEDHVWESPRELLKNCWGSLKGLNLGGAEQRANSYIVSVQFEKWRRRTEQEPTLLASLKNSESFVMWDGYGLPQAAERYDEEHMTAFLAGFDGCDRLVAKLLDKCR